MAVRHPAPVNQFYQLDRDTPTSPYVKTSRWNHIHGTVNFDSVLCMAAEGAVALDVQTDGRVHASPGRVHDYQDDRSGGIGVDDVQVAWQRGWSQYLLTPDWYNWSDVMYAVRVQGRHAVIGVDYEKVPYAYQMQKGATFDHALGIDAWRSSDSRILRYDSLDTKAVWVPQSAIRPAAEYLALRVRGTSERLFVALTKSRPVIDPRWIVAIDTPRSPYTPLYTAPNGTRLEHGVSKATYICTRSKVSGLWWYRILSAKDGSATANAGRYFKPNAGTTARLA